MDNSFDRMASSLIGHTASFLDQYSFSRLSVANRACYLGCQSPNTLQELDLFKMCNECASSMNLLAFSSVKCITLSPIDFTQQFVIESLKKYFPRLNKLIFVGAINAEAISKFIQKSGIDFKNITNLTCHEIYGSDNTLSNLLSQFCNLKSLFLSESCAPIDVQHLQGVLRNVTSLGLFHDACPEYARGILASVASQLTYFYHGFDGVDMSQISFQSLKRLLIDVYNRDTLIKLIGLVPKAKQLEILDIAWGAEVDLIPTDTDGEAFEKVLSGCQKLKYLRIQFDNQTCVSMVMTAIENALLDDRQSDKESFKLRVQGCDEKKIVKHIVKIVMLLKISKVKQFAVIVEDFADEQEAVKLQQQVGSEVNVEQRKKLLKSCQIK